MNTMIIIKKIYEFSSSIGSNPRRLRYMLEINEIPLDASGNKKGVIFLWTITDIIARILISI